MIIDDELYIKIYEAEKEIAQLERELGPDHPYVAEALEVCARLMKRAQTRLLEAGNLQARARLIRSKAAEKGEPRVLAAPELPEQKPSEQSYFEPESCQPSELEAFSPEPVSSETDPTTIQAEIDDTFWHKTISIEFPDTLYLPNHYASDSNLHELEVLAFAYENNDRFARASMNDEDALRVWGWIIKQRTGRYPKTFELMDKKAKRLRRREFGPDANTIDFRVTPTRPFPNSSNSTTRSKDTAKPSASKAKSDSEPTIEDAVQHLQTAAHIIGEAASEGMKDVAHQVQEATQDISKNVQIITGIMEKDLRKWLKKKKRK